MVVLASTILFPNAGTVVAGGQAIVPGDPLRGLLVQSKAAIGSPGPFACGEETNAVFEPANLSSEQIKSPFKDLAMRATAWFVNQAPMIEIEEVACLNSHCGRGRGQGKVQGWVTGSR